MGKRWCAALLCAVLACSMTGCGDFLDREWYEVKDHSPTYYEGEGRDVLRADTYQDLVNNILILVGNHAESGTIWLYYAQEGLDAAEAAEKASREVEKDTPMGSYAVSYIQYTVDDTARNYSEIVVTIGYKRTEKEIINMVHATNVSALHDLLSDAAAEGKTSLVVQLSAFEGQSYQVRQAVAQVQAAHDYAADRGWRYWISDVGRYLRKQVAASPLPNAEQGDSRHDRSFDFSACCVFLLFRLFCALRRKPAAGILFSVRHAEDSWLQHGKSIRDVRCVAGRNDPSDAHWRLSGVYGGRYEDNDIGSPAC